MPVPARAVEGATGIRSPHSRYRAQTRRRPARDLRNAAGRRRVGRTASSGARRLARRGRNRHNDPVDIPPPPPLAKVSRLELIALVAAMVAFVTFGLLINALRDFRGDWDGPMELFDRNGRVWWEIEAAWAYLVPLIVVLSASAAATLGCLIARVLQDARR
jgi:hypothetical protein